MVMLGSFLAFRENTQLTGHAEMNQQYRSVRKADQDVFCPSSNSRDGVVAEALPDQILRKGLPQWLS
jgi:hypothetical protein